MPVSTPSYFPPQKSSDQIIGINAGIEYYGARCFLAGAYAGSNSTVTDIIVIGDNAMTYGSTDANLVGSIAIGSGALENWEGSDGSVDGPVTAIGYHAMQNAVSAGNSVAIGSSAASSGAQIDNSVMIGASVAAGKNTVHIGYKAATGASCTQSVVIGASAQTNSNNGTTNCVTIGYEAGSTGANATFTNSIVIGSGAQAASDTIAIGTGALSYLFNFPTGVLAVEQYFSATLYPLIYGDFASGNVILGGLPYADRDITATGATNIVRLVNGTKKTSAAPIDGGYFYVSAGALHWVGSSGTDTTLASA